MFAWVGFGGEGAVWARQSAPHIVKQNVAEVMRIMGLHGTGCGGRSELAKHLKQIRYNGGTSGGGRFHSEVLRMLRLTVVLCLVVMHMFSSASVAAPIQIAGNPVEVVL